MSETYPMNCVHLITSNGDVFTVHVDLAVCIKYLETAVNNFSANNLTMAATGAPETVFLPNIKSETLSKILQWVQYHMDDSPEPQDPGPPLRLSRWNAVFFNIDMRTLDDIIEAAKFLKYSSLLTVAEQVKIHRVAYNVIEDELVNHEYENHMEDFIVFGWDSTSDEDESS